MQNIETQFEVCQVPQAPNRYPACFEDIYPRRIFNRRSERWERITNNGFHFIQIRSGVIS